MLRSRAVALKQSYAAPTLWSLDVKVISSLLVYMTASVMAVASPLAHSGSRVVVSDSQRNSGRRGPTLPDCRWCLVAYRNAVV